MKSNSAYWFIEMKNGNFWEDCDFAVITYDQNENVGYFVDT